MLRPCIKLCGGEARPALYHRARATSPRRVFVINTRAQRKPLHTWIILVIVKHRLVKIGRIDGPTAWSLMQGAEELRGATQGPSWGYLKVNSSETSSIFGDRCPQNGSKNDLMAPRTTLECPHERPSVGTHYLSLSLSTLCWVSSDKP